MTEEQAYKVKDVAEILQINPRTVRKMIAEGQIRAFKVRDEYRIRQHDLDAYIERSFPVGNEKEEPR